MPAHRPLAAALIAAATLAGSAVDAAPPQSPRSDKTTASPSAEGSGTPAQPPTQRAEIPRPSTDPEANPRAGRDDQPGPNTNQPPDAATDANRPSEARSTASLPLASRIERSLGLAAAVVGAALSVVVFGIVRRQRTTLDQVDRTIVTFCDLYGPIIKKSETIGEQVGQLVEDQKSARGPSVKEIEDAVRRVFKEQSPAPQTVSATTAAKLENDRKELEKKQEELDRRERKVADDESDLARRREATLETKARLDERAEGLKTREAESRSREAKADETLQKAAAESQSAAKALAEANDLRDVAQEDRQAAEQAEESARGLLTRVEAIRDQFWPRFFRGQGPLAEWCDPIEASAVRDDSVGPLLLNALHRYSYLRRAAQPTDLARTVKEVSRYAYAFWAETGRDADQAGEVAEEWARTFEADLAEVGRNLTIRVAKVGQQKDTRWMNYRPEPGRVARVETWGVLAPNGATLEQAEVS